MRGRLLLTTWGVLAGFTLAFAQPQPYPMSPILPQPPAMPRPLPFPQSPALPKTPALPQPPGSVVPPLVGASGPLVPSAPLTQPPIAQPQEIPLPQKENKVAMNSGDVHLKRVVGGWQLWVGQKVLRDFGDRENDARDVLRVFRDVRPTEWVTIGSPRPVVEYGLVNGRPSMTAPAPGAANDDPRSPFHQAGGNNGPAVTGAGARVILPIDLKTVRVEAVRGVWCLRDDQNILLNFGANKADAEQAHAVVLRYGFNRIGVVGTPTPIMNYLFASNDESSVPQHGPYAKLALQAQIDGLTRIGIPVAGVGYVGEMFRFDPKKLELKKDGSEWIIASGTDVIGRFGPLEWTARDALRAIQDSRFNEFCTVGSSGMKFFLVDGKAPTRVPYNVQGRSFDPNTLKVRQYGEKWAITDNGRHLLDCANAAEGETLIRVLKSYGFDKLCHLGPTPSMGVSFFARSR